MKKMLAIEKVYDRVRPNKICENGNASSTK